MQTDGITGVIPFVCILVVWGQYPASFASPKILSAHRGVWLMKAREQVLFFPRTTGAQKVTFGGIADGCDILIY